EVLPGGKPRPVGDGRAVMHERGQEGAAAVVILAPIDRMELAMTGMRRALGRERVLVDEQEELHLGWEGHEVVPLILEGPAPRQAVRRRIPRNRFHSTVLELAVVVVVGVAEKAFVVGPVVLGAERVVDRYEAASRAPELAHCGLGRVELRPGGGVHCLRQRDARAVLAVPIAARGRRSYPR